MWGRAGGAIDLGINISLKSPLSAAARTKSGRGRQGGMNWDTAVAVRFTLHEGGLVKRSDASNVNKRAASGLLRFQTLHYREFLLLIQVLLSNVSTRKHGPKTHEIIFTPSISSTLYVPRIFSSNGGYAGYTSCECGEGKGERYWRSWPRSMTGAGGDRHAKSRFPSRL